ncbi:murein L,D-transpeptidase family protein [Methylocystis sp. Sn-Cys]|uniref:L,D-transpeptidase family protein n=1 Tax=Methylocystis sp. Sn-Cys TaxID=1701263 RepID=UPI001923ADF3|nr:murein L,D-transpeptidase family protein [Methylocystis sp. Sn-Cys]MBL1258340.1 murein L,D-transpeptidase [Methylocystis sp. Sn-Cys]
MEHRILKPAAVAVAFAGLSLSACQDSGLSHRSLAPVPPETLAKMAQLGTTKEAPMLIRAYKKEAELEIWKQGADGNYIHLKTFPMCRWSGQLGPKTQEGDRQVPEGFYSITPAQMNPNSSYYLSFNVGYPNQLDRALGHTGGTIMVHGACSSAGCFSMTDAQIAEIYAIARSSFDGGQRAIQMQSYPFRMTAENLAKHRLDANIGFWKNLKEGNDVFEVTKQEPQVAFCGRRYVFNATASGAMDPVSACPPLKRDPDLVASVSAKAAKDDEKIAELSQSVKPVRVVYEDGGQHPSFASKAGEASRPEALTGPTEIALEEKPARAVDKSAQQLATKSPVVTMAAAKAAAQSHEASTVVRALSPEPHREMSALADENGPTASIKKALNPKK